MKISKKSSNVSDSNDIEKCHFKLSDLIKYVATLKWYLSYKGSKMTVVECKAIMTEIEAWTGFFKMTNKLNLVNGNSGKSNKNKHKS